MEGPDHPFALEPAELEAMVAGIHEAQVALGDGRKLGPGSEEREEMYALARRSLIVTRDLAAGTVLEAEMITVKRPGFGIAPKHLELVLGRALQGGRRGGRNPDLGHGLSSAEAVLLVADAGDDTGLGHIARSSALAQALGSARHHDRVRRLQSPRDRTRDGVEWRPQASAHRIVELAGRHRVVVLDNYRMPTASVDAIASAARLAVMLDFGTPPPAAALAIAPSLARDDRPGMLAGLRYACLSPAFRDLPARDPAAIVEQVLVTTGGGDPGGRAAELAAAAAAALPMHGYSWSRGHRPRSRARPRSSSSGRSKRWPVPSLRLT